MTAPCVDNYVVTCNPAPLTPASEVVVVRTHDLADTGFMFDPLFTIAVTAAVVVSAVVAVCTRKPKETP